MPMHGCKVLSNVKSVYLLLYKSARLFIVIFSLSQHFQIQQQIQGANHLHGDFVITCSSRHPDSNAERLQIYMISLNYNFSWPCIKLYMISSLNSRKKMETSNIQTERPHAGSCFGAWCLTHMS